jgi:flagellar L-ring protein precursor FlgH
MWLLRFSAAFLLLASWPAYTNSLIDIDHYYGLTSDHRAFRVGEPVVILVVESASAKSTAGTGVTKLLELEASSFDNVLGNSVGLGIAGHSEGNGQTVRQGTATTRLSAVITEILPHGMVRLSGEHNLVVNNENQRILVTGIARIDDISRDNTLISNRLANAFIEIQGVGVVNSAQRQGIIARVMTWLGII